ncbi:MAG TPA: hypothetical protein PK771_16370, partial [Spirochaetota bacterium]|nr:hypothetical protein [Spirochaetota bacterium]
IEKKIKIYNEERVSVFIKPHISQMDESEIKKIYNDKIQLDLYRGNGKRTKLSTLAFEMGNTTLGKKLALGENYNAFVVSFVASVIISASFQITGIISLSAGFSTAYDENKNLYFYTNDFGKYLVPMGATLLGLSSGAFVGIFLFSVLMYMANPYNFNSIQGKSFVNQYNNFLKKKLGIPGDLNISYDFFNNHFNMSMSIRL